MLDFPTQITSGDVDPSYIPRDTAEFLQVVQSWQWRMFSGQLYKIMVKGDEDDKGEGGEVKTYVLPFKPNRAQTHLLHNLHYRNLILKARQLGFTTVIDILLFDHATWVKDQRCGIIAHTKEDVTTIFRDKVQFAYESLPLALQERMPLRTQNKSEYLFAHNNSSIRVAMSMRSGTIHRLHVSEMGKLGAKFPQKAAEVVTGSLPTVPKNGIAFIESTAEGQSGEFYKLAQLAEQTAQIKAPDDLGMADWKFFFYPWWDEPKYVLDPKEVTISEADHAYFDEVELEMDTIISMPQRAWYVAKRDQEMLGDQAKMWREYPSTTKEPWQQSTEGKYYPKQLAAARIQKRITDLHYDPAYPVHTFWDIGTSDGTGIWCMQIVDGQHRFLKYIEGWGESYSHFVTELQKTGYRFGVHYLPHDAEHSKQGKRVVTTPQRMLEELMPAWTFGIVERVKLRQHRIDLVRKYFPRALFDQTGCKEGLAHLGNYQKAWSTVTGRFTDEPLKNEATEAADSFGQWAQALEDGQIANALTQPRTPRTRSTGMSA